MVGSEKEDELEPNPLIDVEEENARLKAEADQIAKENQDQADQKQLSQLVQAQSGPIAAEITLRPEDFDKNIIWRTNHILIVKKFLEILNRDTVIPDAYLLSKETGITPETCQKHLEGFKFQNYKPELKLLTYPAALQLAKTASTRGKGQVQAAKLLFQLSEDWIEGMKVYTETGKVFELGRDIITIINEEISDIEIKTRIMLKIKNKLETMQQ